MHDPASPATRLHDVVVVHDQSKAVWRAARGEIRHGRIIVLPRHAPPPEFFEDPAATYTIRAVDGGERVRSFASVTFARADSRPPKEFVFD